MSNAGGASRGAERDTMRRILADLPATAPTDGPRVAVVILNRDGVGHLRRLLPALEATAYSNFEIILVDNASSDRSIATARGFRTRRRLQIVENSENLSFSVANNSAVERTDAQLLLFLNNDVLPMEQHWLGWMVESVMVAGTSACGARLVIPQRPSSRSKRAGLQPDLELQHAGIRFASIDGMPRPRNIGGPDPSAAGLADVHERPAATAACLLIRREAFLAAGGFDPAYVYGYEDVDLCLRLRADGSRIVVDGRAVLWHDESSTRRRDRSTETVLGQRNNRTVFYQRWGRTLFREVFRDRLAGDGFLSAEPVSCSIAVSAGAVGTEAPPPGSVGLRDELVSLGWTAELVVAGASAAPASAEVVVTTDVLVDVRTFPHHEVKIALMSAPVQAWLEAPWVDDFDVLLAADEGAREEIRHSTSPVAQLVKPASRPPRPAADAVRTELQVWIDSRRVGIFVPVADWEAASTSAEYQFARALRRELERRRIPSRICFRPRWIAAEATRDDVVIHMWDGQALDRRPGQTSILWALHQPRPLTDEVIAGYDLVLVPSADLAPGTAARSKVHVVSLPQPPDRAGFEDLVSELISMTSQLRAPRPTVTATTDQTVPGALPRTPPESIGRVLR